jgi:hypothetical protein
MSAVPVRNNTLLKTQLSTLNQFIVFVGIKKLELTGSSTGFLQIHLKKDGFLPQVGRKRKILQLATKKHDNRNLIKEPSFSSR